ncbi:MAG: DUF4380 domain-containing protein [Polyangiaceae bacterium]|nr:DUF4380 domain-containing protein [Polyangiaceae bacterium]
MQRRDGARGWPSALAAGGLLVQLVVACGGEDDGKQDATGGAATGGAVTGGAMTGGAATGGASTGGSATGGLGTGGGPTGGASTGGSATGGTGSATGGTGSATGGTGSATGGTGSATGGTGATGGAATGGAVIGGGPTGGATTGGTESGGALTGGTGVGGEGSGGEATGGEATGGSGPLPVTPEEISSSDFRFTVGDLVLDANPRHGGRIVSLTLDGTDIIEPYDCSSYDPNSPCNSSGSTIWTSPQDDWGWPPKTAIDGGTYSAAIDGDHLLMAGDADPDLGIAITKDISADAGTGVITMTFTMETTKATSAALWQITRVGRGGLVVYPVVSSTNDSTWSSSTAGGFEWIDDSDQTTVVGDGGAKIIGDGSGGWLAYILDGNLFLITYPDVASGDIAPDEGDVEIYPGDGYIELEVQGPYESMAANATSSPWTVRWRVIPVPGTVTVAVGDTGLIEFIQQQIVM